jgi:hypothetical protein
MMGLSRGLPGLLTESGNIGRVLALTILSTFAIVDVWLPRSYPPKSAWVFHGVPEFSVIVLEVSGWATLGGLSTRAVAAAAGTLFGLAGAAP